MSILSNQTDGYGFFYGFHEPDPRQINVRHESHTYWEGWVAYVGGEIVAKVPTKDEAEAAAIKWAQENKE
jgi:hypothetical protein